MKQKVHDLLNYIHRRITPDTQDFACREEGRADARCILEHVTGMNITRLIAEHEITITPEMHKTLENVIEQITVHNKPLAYITGTVCFLDLELTVTPPVLIPRSETESWCAQTIKDIEPLVARAAGQKIPFTILDLCTGSGCIAIALAAHFAQCNVSVIGIDDAEHARACARANAHRHAIGNCTFLLSNLFEQLPENFSCDLIVTNPPYIGTDECAALDPSVKNWEDAHALFAGKHGLDIIRRIVASAPRYLRKLYACGELRCEIGHTQADAVRRLFEENNYASIGTLRDINTIPRVMYGKNPLFS